MSLFYRLFQKLVTRLQLLGYKLFPRRTRRIIKEFHKFYYTRGLAGETWANQKFMGKNVQKCPFDLMSYQQIIWDTRPDIIVECGTAYGGSALFMATIFDRIGKGVILTIDNQKMPDLPVHPRIKYFNGSSTDSKVFTQVKHLITGKKKVMVILDSDHRMEHVLNELKLYSPLVSEGCYLIVEDTNVNGNPVRPEHGPGPWEALKEFMSFPDSVRFKVDRDREGLITFNPSGYLLCTEVSK